MTLARDLEQWCQHRLPKSPSSGEQGTVQSSIRDHAQWNKRLGVNQEIRTQMKREFNWLVLERSIIVAGFVSHDDAAAFVEQCGSESMEMFAATASRVGRHHDDANKTKRGRLQGDNKTVATQSTASSSKPKMGSLWLSTQPDRARAGCLV